MHPLVSPQSIFFFFFNDTATTEIYTLSLHDALPISQLGTLHVHLTGGEPLARSDLTPLVLAARSAGLYTNLITSGIGLNEKRLSSLVDRKSTRLNSSH